MHFAEAISQSTQKCLPEMTDEHGKLWIFCKEGCSPAEGKLVFLKHTQVNFTRIAFLTLMVGSIRCPKAQCTGSEELVRTFRRPRSRLMTQKLSLQV